LIAPVHVWDAPAAMPSLNAQDDCEKIAEVLYVGAVE